MTVFVQALSNETDKAQAKMTTPVVQTKRQLSATWIVENNRLVCKWITL